MLVRPILEYACVAWSPYHQCSQYTCNRNGAKACCYRYALNRYASVLEMISVIGWPTLESSNILKTVMMYKIMKDLSTHAILFSSTSQLRGQTEPEELQQLSCRVNLFIPLM